MSEVSGQGCQYMSCQGARGDRLWADISVYVGTGLERHSGVEHKFNRGEFHPQHRAACAWVTLSTNDNLMATEDQVTLLLTRKVCCYGNSRTRCPFSLLEL